MNKSIVFVVLLAILGTVLYVKFLNKPGSQMVLAQETRKAMDAMMGDFREARSTTIVGVPADGKWHHDVAFNKGEGEVVRYQVVAATHELQRSEGNNQHTVASHMSVLNVRRQPGVLDVLEVQLQAENQSTLVSNFKIRTRE